jgi:hypothetical protein
VSGRKRREGGDIVGLQWLNIHVAFRGDGLKTFLSVFTWEIVLKSTGLN